MKFRAIVSLLLLFTLLSCKKDDAIFQLRVKNISEFDYTDLYIDTSGGENDYGTVEAGTYSEYRKFSFAYKYAHIRFYINDKKFEMIPNDYVGEQLFDRGDFTYVINVASFESGAFTVAIVRD